MPGGQRVVFHKKPRKTNNNKVVVDRNNKRRSSAGHDYYIKWDRRRHLLPVRNILVLSLIVLCCISICLPLWLHQLSTVTTTEVGSEKHSQYNSKIRTAASSKNNNKVRPSQKQQIIHTTVDLNNGIAHNNNQTSPSLSAIFATEKKISCKKHNNGTTSSSSLAILVLSARNNHDRRQAIRDTWGLTNHHSVYFVLGGTYDDNNNNSDVDEILLIEKEMDVYQDLIIDTKHPDSYQSLPHKVKYGLQWIVLHLRRCSTTTIEWILKADDDIYVHVDSLDASLAFSFPHQGKKSSDDMVVVGRIQRNRVVQHFGKWAENTNEYHGIVYPPWPLGSCGYVMNRQVAMWIVDHYESLSEKYQGEDTSLGIWLEDIQEKNITWIHAPPQFVADGNCQTNTDALVIGHKMTTAHLHQCYDLHRQQPLRVFDLLLSNNSSSPSTHHDAANKNNEPVVDNDWEIQMAKDRQARKSQLEDRKKKEARRRQEREEKRRQKEKNPPINN